LLILLFGPSFDDPDRVAHDDASRIIRRLIGYQ
jgi:hypothetical protein